MLSKQLTMYVVAAVISSRHGFALGERMNSSSECDVVEPLGHTGSFVGDDSTWTTRCRTKETGGDSTLKEPFALDNETTVKSVTNASNESTVLADRSSPSWYIIFKRFQFVTTGIYFPLVTFAAFFGNILTVIVLCKGFSHSRTYVYLLGLTVANILFSVTFFPKLFRAYDSVRALRSYQTFYSYYLVYVSPLAFTAQTSGVWVIILFTIERFVALTFPMKVQRYFGGRRSKIAVTAAFIFGLALNFNRFFRRQVVAKVDHVTGEQYYSYTLSDIGRNETFDAVSFWSYLILTEIIPFPILVTLNSLIIYRVWHARFTRMKLSAGNEQKDKERYSRENQITRLLIMIVFAFVVCNVAACAGSIFVAIHGSSVLYGVLPPEMYYLLSVGATLYNTNPLVNCILYTVNSKAIRDGMKSVICLKTITPGTMATSVTSERRSDYSLKVEPPYRFSQSR